MAKKTLGLSHDIHKYLSTKNIFVETLLGKGGYADVYKAKLGYNEVAVKVTDLSQQTQWYRKEVLPQEMQIALTVDHQYIIKTYDIFMMKNRFVFMVGEFADGGDLVNLLDQNPNGIAEPIVRRLFCQVVDAIKYLHGIGVAHCDIKPDNILVHQGVVKLCDFGNSNISVDDSGQVVLTRAECGTYEYLSPEQFVCDLFDRPYDPFMSDCYSLGVLLFLLITNEYPFDCRQLDLKYDEDVRIYLRRQMRQKWKQNHKVSTNTELISLLTLLLTPDPSARITSFHIPSHPWFSS